MRMMQEILLYDVSIKAQINEDTEGLIVPFNTFM